MRAYVANPIYDVCFKYLMEDKVVAKHLLSALLKKEIVEVSMLNRELPFDKESKIKMYRIDFSARVKNADGSMQQVIIEVQKSWAESEILRFRRYLGQQYSRAENMINPNKASESKGIPIVSIYILGHYLLELQKPVIYVRRAYLDYEDNKIEGTDNFIESLTHDSIVVQIPCLPSKTRNRLDRLLRFFDQKNKTDKEGHFLSFDIDDTDYQADEGVKAINHRLAMAAATQEVRDIMEVEDEVMQSLESRDKIISRQLEVIAKGKEELAQSKEELAQNKEKLAQNKEELAQNKEELAQNKKALAQNKQTLSLAVRTLLELGLSDEVIALKLSISKEFIEEIRQQN